MKYFIFLLLSVPLLCALPNGKDCQSNNIYEEYTKLKEDYDKIKKHEEWVQEYYQSKIKEKQQLIESLQFTNAKLEKDMLKRNTVEQNFMNLRNREKFQIELWSQETYLEDFSYFILIFLENQVLVKIYCNKNKCNSEKKYLHNAVLEGVHAQMVEYGQLKKGSVQYALDLIYSEINSKMSNTEYIRQLFKALKEQ